MFKVQNKRAFSTLATLDSYNQITKRAKLEFDPMELLENAEEVQTEQDAQHLLFDLMREKVKDVYAKENHIYFNADVDKRSIDELIDIIDKINTDYDSLCKNKMVGNLKPKPLYLHINSFGGGLLSCFKGIDAIISSKIPIYTIIDGVACSCGSLMAAVGKKRYMTPHSSHLMHQLSGGMRGKFSELEDEMENKKGHMDRIKKIYLNHSKMDMKQIEEQLTHDSFWGAARCIKEGLVDELWE